MTLESKTQLNPAFFDKPTSDILRRRMLSSDIERTVKCAAGVVTRAAEAAGRCAGDVGLMQATAFGNIEKEYENRKGHGSGNIMMNPARASAIKIDPLGRGPSELDREASSLLAVLSHRRISATGAWRASVGR